ncbi:MAG TPA: glycoside hydrolase family 3 N-terminal domain-containing protein [Candidatus Dormibacteraeota bacterium]|nr:glycoside hydrolase family 3 N-terminal domain-containing protein [Candidatus Dormibacteraeota bacterium]
MRPMACLLVALFLAGCSSAPAARSVAPSTYAATSGSTPSPATPVLVPGREDAILGPAGMTLRQEIGAVMMVGFKGPLTPSVLDDWRQRQFGGLVVMPLNQNAHTPAAIRQLIASVRGVMAHPLLAATNQEGGTVCFSETRVPCLAGARQAAAQGPAAVEGEMSTMSEGLKALGFDINFAPVADVWDGVQPVMGERSYGQSPQLVAQDVTAAIAGIHAAGMYAAAKHFPGQGTANADTQVALPLVGESAQTLITRDWVPFKAAVDAHVDMVMIGHLNVPAIDPSAPASMSVTVMRDLRSELGYQGIVISDDLEMGALSPQYPPPIAAVRFLENGGDMVIVSHSIGVADATYDAIHTAVLNATYPRAQLDASVQKLLSLGNRYMP